MRLFAALLLLVAAPALAAPLPIAWETGTISWDPPIDTDQVTHHTVYCAPISGGSAYATTVQMPAVKAPIKAVLPEPGAYTCTVSRTNVVGESEVSPASLPFASFPTPSGPTEVPIAPKQPIVSAGT